MSGTLHKVGADILTGRANEVVEPQNGWTFLLPTYHVQRIIPTFLRDRKIGYSPLKFSPQDKVSVLLLLLGYLSRQKKMQK